MKHYTIAKCFSTFVLPHTLFVPEFQDRKKTGVIYCLGWNIGLFPEAEQREQQIDMVWKLVQADNCEAPPPGSEQGFKRDLRLLSAAAKPVKGS